MYVPELLLGWFMVMFPLVYSPGPANTLYAANGAQFGLRRTMPFMAGINLGFVLQSLLVGFGLSGVLLAYPPLLVGLRWLGVAYIIYLGCLFLRAAVGQGRQVAQCLTLRDGLILTAINPKAWVMQLMMFSQFLEPQTMTQSVFQLTAWLMLLNISGHVVWTLLGSVLLSRAAHRFSPRRQNLLFALMLFASVGFLL